MAKEFARGHRGLWNPDPVVWEATVSKDAVAFITKSRGEDEIVLLEPPIVPCGNFFEFELDDLLSETTPATETTP